jgi:malate dehydrogenase (oxaloacetate-decarboxylating)(NADP+)
VLKSWPRPKEARIAVVTDGSRILGLGDLGINGMPISIGKLSLYVAGAGIRPQSTIPICLDLGTNNETFLNDPLYLGSRQKRPSPKDMEEFMDEFMDEVKSVFPNLMVQFEDFSTDEAFKYLERFRNHSGCSAVFNDDIQVRNRYISTGHVLLILLSQGTGAVVLSGFINAAKLSSQASGRPLTDHRILFLGAGSAGVGVASQLQSYFTLQGMSEKEARERIWLVDSQGLVYDTRGRLADHKKCAYLNYYVESLALTFLLDFARKDYTGPPLTNLLDVIDYVKPTALMGLSTIGVCYLTLTVWSCSIDANAGFLGYIHPRGYSTHGRI